MAEGGHHPKKPKPPPTQFKGDPNVHSTCSELGGKQRQHGIRG